MNLKGYAVLLILFSGSALASKDVAPVTNELYKSECSACHMAYQPGFLPARSWEKIFSNLHDHFGENAELPADDAKILKAYAMENAADHSDYKRSVKVMKSLSSRDTPLRITEIKYIINKHHEVPNRLIKSNPKVKSLSRCEACHTRADTGSYSEHEVKIPGGGRWE